MARLSCLATLCSACRPSDEPEILQDGLLGEVEVDGDVEGPGPLFRPKAAAKLPGGTSTVARGPRAQQRDPVASQAVLATSPRGEEGLEFKRSSEGQEPGVQICPVSGLSTLEGVCPFAKPKKSSTEQQEAPKRKMRLKLDFQWEDKDKSLVTIQVRPHLKEQFETLGLPDTASKDDIRRQYLKLAKQHHPDRNSNEDAAKERFQNIEKAYEALKDTNGEMGFPWEKHPDSQKIMSGDETVRMLGKLGAEAWDAHHLEALQLRHMVRQCPEVKLLVRKRESGIARAYQAECWIDALCMDPSNGSDHVVKLYRRESDPIAISQCT
mmetsp:Transcript_108597/g.317744  ORF Transcript_108597/g.317744 Transcript_108597/m.317744 type:complete len:324 (-) Transcript_108597:144-1115(-)